MCTYITMTEPVVGSGATGDGWIDLASAVVYYDHPQDAPVDHALCIDFRGSDAATDPSSRVAVELDAASARRLAATILATLDEAGA